MSEPQPEAIYLVLPDLPEGQDHLLVEVRRVRLKPGELLVVELEVPRAEVHPEVLEILAAAVARRAVRLAVPR